MMMPAQTRFAMDTAQSPTLLPQAFAPGWELRADCVAPGCDAAASIDPGPWLAQGLAGLSLERLETRLRCVCGARRARLEIAPSTSPPQARQAIYVFY